MSINWLSPKIHYATILLAILARGDDFARAQTTNTPQKIAIDQLRNATEQLRQREITANTYQSRLNSEVAKLAKLNQQKKDSISSTQNTIKDAVFTYAGAANIIRKSNAGEAISLDNVKEGREIIKKASSLSNPIDDFKKFHIAATQYEKLEQMHAINEKSLAQFNSSTDAMYIDREMLVSRAKASGYLPANFQPTDFRPEERRNSNRGINSSESKRLDRADSSVLGSPCLDYNKIGESAGCSDGTFTPSSQSPNWGFIPSGRAPEWSTFR